MKFVRIAIFIGILLSALVAGCARVATKAQWQEVVPQTLFAEKLRIAAFLNEDFGVTGGAGDIGKASHTSDGGKTWKEESLPAKLFGAPYISRDGKFVTLNKWGEGTTLLKYE